VITTSKLVLALVAKKDSGSWEERVIGKLVDGRHETIPVIILDFKKHL